ncbi:MAG: hypothetical protein K2G89_01400 [Lachnospiraceae bacterium]|nr:hypothetical protein [Lachnospiraceae bacterium]
MLYVGKKKLVKRTDLRIF